MRWAPVAVWAACISWFSTEAFSAQSTHHYIDPALRLFFWELSPAGFRLAHTIIRKAAHLTEYAVLAILLCRALTVPRAPMQTRLLVRTLVYCALYASADELHQVFEPSRTGSPFDVVIDVVGASAGATLFVWRRGARTGIGTRTPAEIEISARSRGRASGL